MVITVNKIGHQMPVAKAILEASDAEMMDMVLHGKGSSIGQQLGDIYGRYVYDSLRTPGLMRTVARKKRKGPSYRQRQKAGKAARADSLRRKALRGS